MVEALVGVPQQATVRSARIAQPVQVSTTAERTPSLLSRGAPLGGATLGGATLGGTDCGCLALGGRETGGLRFAVSGFAVGVAIT